MTEPEQKNDAPHSEPSDFAAALRGFILALRQVLTRSDSALIQSRRQQAEADQIRSERAEAELRARYPQAIHQAQQLTERARRHGVIFAQYAAPHHQAALLDMLDNPTAPTPLIYMHMTWVTAIDPATGRSTVSGTHPAVRALYRWTAHHVHAMRANPDDPRSIRAVENLRALTPLDRAEWTEGQWRSHEHREAEQWRAARAAFRQPVPEPNQPIDRRRLRPDRKLDT